MQARAAVHVYVCKDVHICTYARRETDLYVHADTDVDTYAGMQIYIHTYTHIYICIYTYVYEPYMQIAAHTHTDRTSGRRTEPSSRGSEC